MEGSLIIMAAGQSKRMKKNKLFLKHDRQTFIERAFELALNLNVKERILVIRSADLEQLHVPAEFTIVLNDETHNGQSYSVKLGTEVASGTGYLYLPIDQPLLTQELVSEILIAGTTENIVMPEYEGKLSSPVYFGKHFRNELLEVKGAAGGREVRDSHPDAWCKIIVEQGELLKDIDTPQAYRNLSK